MTVKFLIYFLMDLEGDVFQRVVSSRVSPVKILEKSSKPKCILR